jgi:beta-N-acetylhexosaminidase
VTKAWQPGQLLFAGFEGTEVPGDLAALISEGRVGGAILFARNVRDPDQLRRLVGELRALAPSGAPLTVAIDQEGGRVLRMREPWTLWPPMRSLGDGDDPERTRKIATAMAVEMVDVGIDLDFAPVVDVDSNRENPIVGDRSFGTEPGRVGRHARAFVEAMQAAGVSCCAKHFPGHGDTNLDSHFDLPRLEHDLDRLRRVELPPFAEAIAAGVDSVMTAHVLFERLDARRPATLSPDVMAILREELSYDGLVFTDDLEMGAVAKHFTVEERTLEPLRAGVDALLVCRQADLREEVLRLLEGAPDHLVEKSIERVVAFKRVAADRTKVTGGAPPYPDHAALLTGRSSVGEPEA